jgi:hypothetical protein
VEEWHCRCVQLAAEELVDGFGRHHPVSLLVVLDLLLELLQNLHNNIASQQQTQNNCIARLPLLSWVDTKSPRTRLHAAPRLSA